MPIGFATCSEIQVGLIDCACSTWDWYHRTWHLRSNKWRKPLMICYKLTTSGGHRIYTLFLFFASSRNLSVTSGEGAPEVLLLLTWFLGQWEKQPSDKTLRNQVLAWLLLQFLIWYALSSYAGEGYINSYWDHIHQFFEKALRFLRLLTTNKQ